MHPSLANALSSSLVHERQPHRSRPRKHPRKGGRNSRRRRALLVKHAQDDNGLVRGRLRNALAPNLVLQRNILDLVLDLFVDVVPFLQGIIAVGRGTYGPV